MFFGLFTSKIGEDDSPICRLHIFQMRWFNHQPVRENMGGAGGYITSQSFIHPLLLVKVFLGGIKGNGVVH